MFHAHERKKEVSNPTPSRSALCFRNRSGSQPVFLPHDTGWWSVRESNPLRRAFQTPALPFELTDRPLHERKAEDSNLTRRSVRIAFQAISAASRICLPWIRPQSGRQDSHLRSPVPQTGALTRLSYALKKNRRASFTSWPRTREHYSEAITPTAATRSTAARARGPPLHRGGPAA